MGQRIQVFSIFISSKRRHTRSLREGISDVCFSALSRARELRAIEMRLGFVGGAQDPLERVDVAAFVPGQRQGLPRAPLPLPLLPAQVAPPVLEQLARAHPTRIERAPAELNRAAEAQVP